MSDNKFGLYLGEIHGATKMFYGPDGDGDYYLITEEEGGFGHPFYGPAQIDNLRNALVADPINGVPTVNRHAYNPSAFVLSDARTGEHVAIYGQNDYQGMIEKAMHAFAIGAFLTEEAKAPKVPTLTEDFETVLGVDEFDLRAGMLDSDVDAFQAAKERLLTGLRADKVRFS